MRRQSRKAAKRAAETRQFREQFIQEVGCCELCGYNPSLPGGYVRPLACHEIARGQARQRALDQRCAILVLCQECHMRRIHGPEDWPEARQLALLRRSRPDDFDLSQYNLIVGYGPDRISEEDVDGQDAKK